MVWGHGRTRKCGLRSTGAFSKGKAISGDDWDFSRTIARAEADGHPDVPMLKKLADVILKKQPLESL